MRVAALAPLAAMLVSLANAAPVPNADPLSLCFFGFGINCGPSTTTSSVVAAKTTSSSVIPSSTVKTSSVVITSTASSKASSVVAASPTTKATTTTAAANWTWLWDPAYVFNMWNNFNAFRWEKYNDCSFNGYSLTYVKAWYWQTYGFQPMTGCQWADVHNFLAKYAVKASVAPPSTQNFTPGCANPFGGANVNWKPTSSSSAVSTKATSAVSSKASSASVAASSASVAASSVRSSVASVAQSSAASQTSAAFSLASQAASSSAVSQASSPAASQASQAASSSAAQASVLAGSSASPSSNAQSAIGSDSASQAFASSTDSGSIVAATASSEPSASSDSASAPAPSATSSAITGTPVTLSNGKVVQSIGCVAEIDGRKFKAASYDDPSVMTNEWCSSWCSNLGYPVSGTEYAKECYCAGLDALSTYTVSDQCVMPCSGDASGSSICGGPQALSVLVDQSATRTVSLPSNWVSRGCYQDNSSRVLTYQAASGKPDNTLESCAAQCSSLGYSIAAAEYGSECFCGNSFVGGPVAIDSGKCDMPCSGNGGDKCGGSFSMTVASLFGAF